MKLQLVLLIYNVIRAYNIQVLPVCQSDQLGGPPLATLFQKNATNIVGSVNSVQTYIQNRVECVPMALRPIIATPTVNQAVPKKVAGNIIKPIEVNMKPIPKPVNVQLMNPKPVKEQLVVPKPVNVQLIKPKPVVNKQYEVNKQYVQKENNGIVSLSVSKPMKFVLPSKPLLPQPVKNTSPASVTTPSRSVSVNNATPRIKPQAIPVAQSKIPTPIRFVPILIAPKQTPAPIPAINIPVQQNTPQFIPLKSICNMNVQPPIPECVPHRIPVPIVNFREMPQIVVPQSIVPQIVQNKGIQDVDLIKVINGISLVELRRLSKTVGDIYSIVNRLSAEIVKQRAETDSIKNSMLNYSFGSVLCADNPFRNTQQATPRPTAVTNQERVCFKVLVDDKNVNHNRDVANVNLKPLNSVINRSNIASNTQSTLNTQGFNLPICTMSNMSGPCVYIANPVLQKQTNAQKNSITCSNRDAQGICIDSRNTQMTSQQPTPSEEAIFMKTLMTIGNAHSQPEEGNKTESCEPGDANCPQPQYAVGKKGNLEEEAQNGTSKEETNRDSPFSVDGRQKDNHLDHHRPTNESDSIRLDSSLENPNQVDTIPEAPSQMDRSMDLEESNGPSSSQSQSKSQQEGGLINEGIESKPHNSREQLQGTSQESFDKENVECDGSGRCRSRRRQKEDTHSGSALEPDPHSRSALEPDPYSKSALEPDTHSGSALEPDTHSKSALEPDTHSGSAHHHHNSHDNHKDTPFNNHSDLWNKVYGDDDTTPYTYSLLDDSQYSTPSLKESSLLNILLGTEDSYHKAHWKNVLFELAKNEPLYDGYRSGEDEDLMRLLGRISSSDVCTGISDRNDCLKLYNYLLMNSKSYLTSTLINSLLSQKLSREEFSEELNKMILRLVLKQETLKYKLPEKDYPSFISHCARNTPDDWLNSRDVSHTNPYGSCSLGEAEVSPGRCITIMKMSDLIRGEKYNDCTDPNDMYSLDPRNSEGMMCSVLRPSSSTKDRLSTVYLSDLLT